MGTKYTPVQLSGFLVPYAWSATHADDRAVGTDYTEAEPQYGATTWSGSGRPGVALEVSGTPDDGVSALTLQVVEGGAPDGSVGVAWSSNGGTTYYGRDALTLTTGYLRVRTSGRTPSAVVHPSTGVMWLAFYEASGSDWLYRVMSRSEAGVWGGLTTVLTIPVGASTWAACGLAIAPDGSLILAASVPGRTTATYQLDLYRSADGVTWRRVGQRAAGLTDTVPFRSIALAFGSDGAGMMFVGVDTGGTPVTTQLHSADGGATWTDLDVGDAGEPKSLIYANGMFILLFYRVEPGDDVFAVYRGGLATTPLLSGPSVDLATEATVFGRTGGCLISDEIGRLYAYFTDEASGSIAVRVSHDYGATFETPVFGAQLAAPVAATAIVPGAGMTGVLQRGTVVIVSSAWAPAGSVSGGMYELRAGGASNVTMTSDITGWYYSFFPTDTMVAYGWAATDTGAPTITLSELTGQSIVCGAGDTASRRYTDTEALAAHAGWFALCIRVTTGTATFRAKVAGAGVLVDITSTQIRAYDMTGAASSYVNHAAGTDNVEILVCVDYPRTRATVWYRVVDLDAPGRERRYTELAQLTGLGAAGADVHHWVSWAASTTAIVQWAGVQFTSAGAPLISAGQAVADLRALPVASASRSYAGAGALVRGLGAVAYPDGETYTAAATSLYSRGNVDPRVEPSPRRAWRSTGSAASPYASTAKLRHTLVPDTSATAQYLGSDLWAIWLDGLVGVPEVRIATAGGTVATLDLRQPLTYQAAGASVRPTSAAGTTVTRPWVQQNELAGGHFQYANGEVRRISGNTAGALTDTGAPTELRTTIYVADVDGTEDTSGAGYIWPPRTLILWYLRGAQTVIQEYVELQLLPTSAIGPEGYREIGVCAIGRVQLLGYGVDRTEARAQASGYDRQELADRSTVYSYRGPVRRTVEVAIVDTHVDLQQVRGSGVSADYVVCSGDAAAYPGADRHADPLVLEGLAREVDGVPVVWLPQIPVETGGSGTGVVTYWRGWGMGAVYGYLQAGRREQIQIGRYGVNDGARYSTLTIEEEV